MGNCQAIDTATSVIQHPCGKVDKFYWPVSANEIMKMNPGHYVALLITSTLCHQSNNSTIDNHHPITTTTTTTTTTTNNNNTVRITRVKLLRPTDTLVLGQVYRLITTQEVMKGLWAKKCAKMKKNNQPSESSSAGKSERVENDQKLVSRVDTAAKRSELERTNQVKKQDLHRQRTSSTNSAVARSKIWQPSLHSITEATS